MPKVSVIIPVYNTEKYLRQCLDSVVNQTLKDIEIICVNDGSTDSSLQILEEYAQKDNRIKVISQKNQGVSVVRNVGFNQAKGEYVMFLDSDDYIELETCELTIEKIKSTDSDICCFGINEIIDNKSTPRKNEVKYLSIYENKELDIEAKKIFLINACGKLFKKSFIKNNLVEFPKGIKSGEDAIFNLECLFCNPKYVILNKFLYNYTKDNSASTTKNPKNAVKNDIEGFKYFFKTTFFKNAQMDLQIIAMEKFIYQLSWYYDNVIKYRLKYLIEIIFFKKYIYEIFSKEFLSYVPNIEILNSISILKNIFSIRISYNRKYKIITILGIKIKIKNKIPITRIKLGSAQYFDRNSKKLFIKPERNINIAFAIDDNYVQQCAVTIVSILSNSSLENFYNFYVLNTNLKKEDKIKIESLKEIRDFNIEYVDVSNFDISKLPLNRSWISVATYYRLFLSQVLPQDMKQIIYMDCDMIVEDDLAKLWDYDISNYYAAVVEDESSRVNVERLGLQHEKNYFNAGMIVFNLKKIREIDLLKESINYFDKNYKKITMQDQDLLNYVLNGKCIYLPLKWNLNTPACFGSFSDHYYNEDAEREAFLNPGIIHYTGKYKPWLVSSMHPLSSEYKRYLSLTGFKDDIKKYRISEMLSKIYVRKFDWELEKYYLFGIRIYKHRFGQNTLIENIFSIKNKYQKNIKYKVWTILGIQIRYRRGNA